MNLKEKLTKKKENCTTKSEKSSICINNLINVTCIKMVLK